MFSRDNKMDYRSVRPFGWSGLIAVALLSSIMILLRDIWHAVYFSRLAAWIPKLVGSLGTIVIILTAVIGKFLSPAALELLSKPVRRAISLFSPLVALLLMFPSVVTATYTKQHNTVAKWVVFILLLVVVLLLTVSRLHFPRIG